MKLSKKVPSSKKNSLTTKRKWYQNTKLLAVMLVFVFAGVYFTYRSFAAVPVVLPIGSNDLVLEYSLSNNTVGSDVPISSILPFRLYGSGLAICGNDSAANSGKTAVYYSKQLTTAERQQLVQKVADTNFLQLKQPPKVKTISGAENTITINLKSGLYEYSYTNAGTKPTAYAQAQTIIQNFCQTLTTPYQASSATVYTSQVSNVSQTTTTSDDSQTSQTTNQVSVQKVSGAATQTAISQVGRSTIKVSQVNGKTVVTSVNINLPAANRPAKAVNVSSAKLSKADSNKVEAAATLPVEYSMFCATDSCIQPRADLAFYEKTSQSFYAKEVGKTFDITAPRTLKGSHPKSWYLVCHNSNPAACPKMMDPACRTIENGCNASTRLVDDPLINTFNNIGADLGMFIANSDGTFTVYTDRIPSHNTQVVLGFSTGNRNMCGATLFGMTFGMLDFSNPGYLGYCTNTANNFDFTAISHELGHNFGLDHTTGSTDASGTPNGGIMAYDDDTRHYFPDDSYLVPAQRTALQTNPYFHDIPTGDLYPSNKSFIGVFSRGADGNQLINQNYQSAPWRLDTLGGQITGKVAASTWGKNHIDLFARGFNGHLLQRTYSNGKWAVGWTDLGDVIASAPTAISWGPGRIDVLARNASNQVVHKIFKNGAWQPGMINLGGTITGTPAVTTWGTNRLDVFVRGGGNAIYHKYYNGTTWSASYENLGGTINTDPAAVAWGPGRIDIFGRGGDNKLYHKWYNGKWSAYESLGGVLTSSPTATSWGPGRIDVFARGGGNGLYHKWFTGTSWSAYESLGGILTSDPVAISWK